MHVAIGYESIGGTNWVLALQRMDTQLHYMIMEMREGERMRDRVRLCLYERHR